MMVKEPSAMTSAMPSSIISIIISPSSPSVSVSIDGGDHGALGRGYAIEHGHALD